jgi:hypothetical protein
MSQFWYQSCSLGWWVSTALGRGKFAQATELLMGAQSQPTSILKLFLETISTFIYRNINYSIHLRYLYGTSSLSFLSNY